jgi:hypothetical protein
MNRKKWAIPVHVPEKTTWYTVYGPLITKDGQIGMIMYTTPKSYQNSILELKHLTGVVLLVNHTHGPG